MEPLRSRSTDIRATYRWLAHGRHGVSEVRVIRQPNGIMGIGFFDDEDAFVEACLRANAAGNVYVGIQPRPRRLLDLAKNALRAIRTGAGRTDIEVVSATVIDIDPAREKHTASAEVELAQALAAAERAADWFEAQGFRRPLRIMSGNGAQLWCAVPPIVLDGGNLQTVQANLKVLEAEVRKACASPRVVVDSIHDLPRIIKVVGTVSRKGMPTPERPHRVSVALDLFERLEDEVLRERLLRNPPARMAPQRLHTVTRAAQAPASPTAGQLRPGAPVDMCSPVQHLWEHGYRDRSLAIFDMVRFFMHKGLALPEITARVLEYDRRRLGKLSGRDGPAYVRQCFDKIAQRVGGDGAVAPPCHSMQRIGYCRVNREPGLRCEIYDRVFDVAKAIASIPVACKPSELAERLEPVLRTIAHRDPAVTARYLALIQQRFGLKARDLRRALKRTSRPPGEAMAVPAIAERGGSIDGEIHEDGTRYYTVDGRGQRRIVSSFTIQPTMKIATEDGDIIVCRAFTDSGAVVDDLRLPLQAFQSRREFMRHLRSADLQWTGSDNNVQGLLRILARHPTPRRPGSTVLGDHPHGEERVWLWPQGAITARGVVSPSPVVYVPNGNSLEARVRYPLCDDDAFTRVARTVFEHVPRVNRPEVVLPVLGWFFATPMKPRFMRKVGSFPTLFLWGTAGSGKTSLCTDVFWPIFGIPDGEPYSATETEFALVKLLSATGSVPVFVDEYKPYDMPRHRVNTLHRYIRRLYRGETEERGRPDQRVNTYRLQAPLCVAGETRPTEAALVERILTANPEKAAIENQPEFRHALRELKAVELCLFAARYIQFCLGREFDADLTLAQGARDALLAGRKVPTRVAANLVVMLMGLHLFEQFAGACGYRDLPSDLGARSAVDAVLDDVLEADHGGVKNALDHFLDMLAVMAVQREIQHRVHYVVRDEVLYVHLESAYDAFRAHCKRIDYEGEIVDLRGLRRLIYENQRQGGYVKAENERAYFKIGSDRRRAVAIALPATSLTADDFPQD